MHDDDWRGLHDSYLAAAAVRRPAQPADGTLRRQERACVLAGQNAMSRAVQCATDESTVVEDLVEAVRVLEPLHPAGGAVTDAQRATIHGWMMECDAYQVTAAAMLWSLRTAAKGASPGPSGWRARHWQRLLQEDTSTVMLDRFTAFVNVSFASGSLDPDLRAMWGACCTIALAKKGGGHRPISMGDLARRLTGRAMLHAAER